MRLKAVHRLCGFAAAAILSLTTAPASAGPTCENRSGQAVRCGGPGAMPVGWTVSPEQRQLYLASLPPDPTPLQLLGLVGVIGCLFALIALMPDFDGWGAGDWDPGEGGDETRP
jgi:hypothetical protein